MKLIHIAVLNIVLFIFLSNNSAAQQNWLWDCGGNGNDEAFSNTIDQNGNIYTTGYFSLSAKFDTTVLISAGSGDIFVSKQNGNGQYQWTVKAGGPSSDRGYSISTDALGEVFITGYYSGRAIFGSDTINSVDGSIDIFVAKLDSGGNFLWAKSFGGSDIDIGLAVHADFKGDAIVTGQFRSTAQFGNFTFTGMNDTAGKPVYSIFIMKLDTAGNVIWAKQGSSKYDDRGLAVSTDAVGNIYFTGQYSDTLSLENVYPNVAQSLGFLAKLDSAGNVIWFQPLLANQVLAYSVQCFENNVYIGGDFVGQLAFLGKTVTYLNKPYNNKIFAAMLDSSGAVIWASCDGSNNAISAQALTVDMSGNVYLAGTFNCIMTEYSSLYGTGIFNSIGFRDVFITKYNSSGIRQYERQFGGPQDEFCSAISISATDHPVIAGSFATIFNVSNGGNFLSNVTNFDSSFAGPNQTVPYCSDANYHGYISIYSDGNRDIFSTSPLDLTRDPYDYFDRSGSSCVRDTLLPYINTGQDTIYGCDSVLLYTHLRTGQDGVIGPAYEYHWSDGQNTDSTYITATGEVYLQLTNQDNCRHYIDSIYVIIYPSPPMPVMATTVGTIRQAIPNTGCNNQYNTLIVVMPDTAILYTTNVPRFYLVYWDTPYGVVNGDSVSAWMSGTYVIHYATRQSICDISSCINVIIYEVGVAHHDIPANYVPQIHFTDSTFDRTDTVRLCQFDFFNMVLIDSTDWAMGDTIDFLPVYVDWTISGGFIFYNYVSFPTTFGYHYQSFQAITTGPCTVTAYIENPINGSILTRVVRNFYLIVFPKPPLLGQWNGPTFACPGDTTLLTVTGATYYKTSGPGIVYISANQDSIRVTKAGPFTCIYTEVDSTTGCASIDTIYFNLTTIPAPGITTIPPNALICPNDSVELIAENGTNYTWTGPLGNVIGYTRIIYGSTPGYYSYTFTDTVGCTLVSSFREIKTYSTPYLTGTPQSMICLGGSVQISVQTNDSSLIQWQPPLSGGSLTQTVSSAGTYICSITSCNITTTASFTVTVDTAYVNITLVGDSVICPGDTSLLIGNSGMSGYQWQPGGWASQTFYATTAATYYLTVTDFYGCTATDSISIDTLPGSSPPIVVSGAPVICRGDSVKLSVSATGRIDWYASYYSASIDSDSTFQTPPLDSNTTYFVTNITTVCHSIKVPVLVSIDPASLSPPILGDSLVCYYDSLVLTTNTIAGGNYHWKGPKGFISSLQSISFYPVDSTLSGYYYLQVSDSICSGPVDSFHVRILPRLVAQITASATTLCAGLNDTIRAVQSFNSYIWMPGGSTDSIIIADTTGTYSLIATDNNGCADSSLTVSLTVIPDPPAPQVRDTNICVGNSVTLTSVSSYSVNWYNDSSLLIFTGYAFTTPVLNDTVIYYVQQVDTNGCKSKFDSATVRVAPLPPVPLLTGDSVYCAGTTITINSSTVAGAIYSWHGPAGFTAPTQNATIPDCLPIDSGSYSLTVLVNGCEDSSFFKLIVYPIPSNQIYTNAPVCVGKSFSLSTDSSAGSVYSWHGPLGFVSTSITDTIPNAALSQTGYYYLKVTNQACSSGVDSVYAKIVAYPAFTLVSDTIVCKGKTITLGVASGYDLYSWSNGTAADSINIVTAGDYIITVTNLPDCSTSDSVKVISVDCSPFIPNVFSPNNDGINDNFYITYEGAQIINITIYNRWGRIVRQLGGPVLKWDGKNEDGVDCSDGTYYYIANVINPKGDNEEFHGFIDLFR